MKIYLPNDADGNVILSNVKVMYEKDGTVRHVDDLIYLAISKKWRVSSGPLAIEPSQLYLNKSDNLKRLAADIDRVINYPEGIICAYANRKKRECSGCKFNKQPSCLNAFVRDISPRVHHLCGDAE